MFKQFFSKKDLEEACDNCTKC